MPDFKTELRAE